MTAAYKIALAAGATLLLIVIASLLLGGGDETETPSTDDGELALIDPATPLEDAPAIDPVPPADDPGLGLDLDPAPLGPPVRGGTDAPDAATRLDYADEPAVEVPVGPSEPNASMTLGRPAFSDDDPLGRAPFEPMDDPLSPPEPQPLTEDRGESLVEPADPTDAEANTGIALSPVDPVGRNGNASLDLEDPPPPAPAPPILRLYTIESGDSLSSIALVTYGSATKWVDIAQANPLVDPNRLRVGQEIKLPDLDGTGPEPATDRPTVAAGDDLPRRGATYIVKSGDSLSTIAKQFYNSSAKWELIYQANRRNIGDDPGRLQLGMELLIPPPDTGAN